MSYSELASEPQQIASNHFTEKSTCPLPKKTTRVLRITLLLPHFLNAMVFTHLPCEEEQVLQQESPIETGVCGLQNS